MKRRDILKGLLTVPVLGAVGFGAYRKKQHDNKINDAVHEGIHLRSPEIKAPVIDRSKKIRLGVIGYGSRGSHLTRVAGFATPDYMDYLITEAAKNKQDTRYDEYMSQEDLGLELTAVCDVLDVHAEAVIQASANIHREGKNGKMGKPAVRYKTYLDLLSSGTVDAVIIATPDHWHAPIAIEAAKRGIHVYVEKPMTWTVEETYELRDIVKKSGIAFQLGHQGRQTDSHIVARDAVKKGLLGKISLVEVTTNRNDPNGAWVYAIDPKGNPQTIDWEQFQGRAPKHDFSLERFFRWRCWWDYSTGLNGDLLTHEFDAINQILEIGIPSTAVCSGGIYFLQDGRTVPDVNHAVFEYKEKEMTLMYSATLANSHYRHKLIMGHDATMEVSDTMNIYAEQGSDQYKDRIASGIIKTDEPIYTYFPGRNNVDAVASATEKYFAARGLLYTYRNGKRLDPAYLHVKEWVDAIRTDRKTSCNIDEGFQCSMTAHMATMSYKTGRRVYWDKDKEVMSVEEKV